MLLLVAAAAPAPASAQALEQEPNEPCALAQDLGTPTLPVTVDGALDSSQTPDVDFFRIAATPGASLEIYLRGASSGAGTLEDPFLGVFDSGCNLIDWNDDFTNLESRLVVTVPGDGALVLGATACCDIDFQGGGSGSYQLSVASYETIGSVTGRIVDGQTGDPLPFASVTLQRCQDFGCFGVAGRSADSDGTFRFDAVFGEDLPAGTYRVAASFGGYQDAETPTFEVGAGEDKSVGDVGLTPLPRIGSISGRITDAVTAKPLPGGEPPFAGARLLRCEDFGCFDVDFQDASAGGQFRFEPTPGSQPLTPGRYQVIAFADEYQQGQTDEFDVAEGEEHAVGDIALQPLPIRISDVQPCTNVPAGGGKCRYTVTITNRLGTRLDGAVWSLVDAFGTGSLADVTRFQTARPRKVMLGSQASAVLDFSFDVPATVRGGASICTELFVGDNKRSPLFNTVAQSGLFCVFKDFGGQLTVLAPAKAHELFDRANGRRMTPPRKPKPR